MTSPLLAMKGFDQRYFKAIFEGDRREVTWKITVGYATFPVILN